MAVQCPKERQVTLESGVLSGELAVQCCPSCGGNWIPPEAYADWRSHQPAIPDDSDLIPRILGLEVTQSPLDTKAALCPECNCFLSRTRVGMKTPFYVERCPNCKGIWCDRGEWEVLEQLGLHLDIDQVFSGDWQTRLRAQEHLAQERRATIEKLGPELAERVFELADVLRQHPNGDFGVAYLMRRFDR